MNIIEPCIYFSVLFFKSNHLASNEAPRRRRTGYLNGIYFISPQGAGNITHEILRLRSGSVRLINFVSQNQSLTDLIV